MRSAYPGGEGHTLPVPVSYRGLHRVGGHRILEEEEKHAKQIFRIIRVVFSFLLLLPILFSRVCLNLQA